MKKLILLFVVVFLVGCAPDSTPRVFEKDDVVCIRNLPDQKYLIYKYIWDKRFVSSSMNDNEHHWYYTLFPRYETVVEYLLVRCK